MSTPFQQVDEKPYDKTRLKLRITTTADNYAVYYADGERKSAVDTSDDEKLRFRHKLIAINAESIYSANCRIVIPIIVRKYRFLSTMISAVDGTNTKGRETIYPIKNVTPERIYERARLTRERGPQFFKSPSLLRAERDEIDRYHLPPRSLQHQEQVGGVKRQQDRPNQPISAEGEVCEIAVLLERIELESEPSRRAYSCGTLKLLSAKTKYQHKFSASLVKVLSVGTLVLRDVRDALVYDSVITKFALDSYYAMRSRILSLFVILVHEPAHRYCMFNCTELIMELVEILKVDTKVDREKALTCFAHFSKHAENRAALVKIHGLMDIFSTIIAPNPRPKLMNLPTKKPSSASSTKEVDSGNFELDSFGRIVLTDETAGLSSSDPKYVQKRKSSPRLTIDHIQFVPDTAEEEEDFSVQEESPPRKKNNRMRDRDVSLLFDGSDDEEETKDFERPIEDKGLHYDSSEDPFLENSRECVLATLVHLSKEKACAVSTLRITTFSCS